MRYRRNERHYSISKSFLGESRKIPCGLMPYEVRIHAPIGTQGPPPTGIHIAPDVMVVGREAMLEIKVHYSPTTAVNCADSASEARHSSNWFPCARITLLCLLTSGRRFWFSTTSNAAVLLCTLTIIGSEVEGIFLFALPLALD